MHGRWQGTRGAAWVAAQRLESAGEPHRVELLRLPLPPSGKRLRLPQCQAQQASLRCVLALLEGPLRLADLCEVAQRDCN